MDDRRVYLQGGPNAGAHVDAYLEYRRIVGDDDGGVPFSEEEYAEYKKRVLPMRLKNRLYVAWVSPTMMDCKLIGPETLCFCDHRFKQHKTDFESLPDERPIHLPCRVAKCPCNSYAYVPLNGSQPIRCTCKHTSQDHHAKAPHKCQKGGCNCTKFHSSFTCNCGSPTHRHQTLVETKAEREARGHPTGVDGVPYQAMGGLTGFSSLMEGYRRLDPSGAGAPDLELLQQPVTSMDHPFLRSQVTNIQAHKRAIGATQEEIDADRAEFESGFKRPGESDMDFYERRYQQRLKQERSIARGTTHMIQPKSTSKGSRISDNSESSRSEARTSGLKGKAPIKGKTFRKGGGPSNS